MNRETLKRVISDQKEELGFISSKHLIKREKLDYAKKMLSEPLVKVITGVRRSGKSTFCHQLLEGKNYSYFNFDDERLAGLSAEDLNVILEELLIENNKPDYLLFDEIQNVPSWELFINRLLRQNYNIIVTGSNGKMLSRELATHLTGRHYQIELYPFSFSEYLDYHKVNSHLNSIKSTKKIAEIKSFFGKYISEGGFPENMNLQFQKLYLRELFDKILIRDIVQRYEIRDLSSLKELGITLLNYFSSLFTYNKLKNSLNFKSVNTVKEYVHYLEETYLFFFLHKFSFKIRDEITSPRKVYSTDTGLINALQTSLSLNQGRLLENVVFLHLKRKYNEIYYYSTKDCEVDFVIIDDNRKISLIQVCADLSNESTKTREFEALRKAKEELKSNDLIVITNDEEYTTEYKDTMINVIPIWKFLLKEE